MRVLITGGAGFLGSHLCDHFLSQGHEVIAMDNLLTGSSANIEHLAGHDRFHFIKHEQFSETFKIAKILLSDEEDLIHKAVGWMLREVGKRDMVAEEKFLKEHYNSMPRTMLRYAIERFPEPKRQRYLKGKV